MTYFDQISQISGQNKSEAREQEGLVKITYGIVASSLLKEREIQIRKNFWIVAHHTHASHKIPRIYPSLTILSHFVLKLFLEACLINVWWSFECTFGPFEDSKGSPSPLKMWFLKKKMGLKILEYFHFWNLFSPLYIVASLFYALLE